MGLPGMQQALVPFRFVTQQQQPLGIRVQPADGINVLGKIKFRQRATCRAIPGELGQHAVRFMEGN